MNMSLSASRRTLPDMVSEAIVKYALKESLQPGDKLPTEKELSQQLGIGRTSLREGIRQLDAIGLLSCHQGKGIYLKQVTLDSLFASRAHIPVVSFLRLSKQEILDLLDVRLMFESEACRLAADRLTDDDLAALRKIHRAMCDALANREEFVEDAVEFHKHIVLSSKNTILSKLFEFIEDLYSKEVSILINFPRAQERSVAFHERILAALTQRDGELAVQHLHEHLEDVREAILNHFHPEQGED
jgi:GntR family transcriptional regulator, transcriptional repressor for pyruvate dehydrogenase complex